MRIVIAAQGEGHHSGTWSGIPYHLGRALEGLGADVGHVNADPPRQVLRGLVGLLRASGIRQPSAAHGPEMAAVRTRVVARRLARERDALVLQLDTGFELPPGTRYVTLHDMTVAQAVPAGWSDPAMMTRRAAAAWTARDRRICRGALACCAASDWTAASIVRDYGVDASRVHVTGFGANLETHPAQRDWSVPRFLFVGREWERKNGAAVLAAFRRVREQVPAATLTVVGEHPPIDEPGVEAFGRPDLAVGEDRARLAGLFERSTCFVLPSLMEPFGIVYLEAGAAGIPSIGTSWGGAATPIGDGGVLVDPGDEEQLVAAMLRLADPATAQELGRRARAHAARFTWTRVAERVLAALEPAPAPVA
ncbi:MAG TPA: glycosyltransferase family 4 protein [Baekduia sp.]|nr:glycosyltransferase family 4 protein [Baekduia sp.]